MTPKAQLGTGLRTEAGKALLVDPRFSALGTLLYGQTGEPIILAIENQAAAPYIEALRELVEERIEERADDYGRDEESWEPQLSTVERKARSLLPERAQP